MVRAILHHRVWTHFLGKQAERPVRHGWTDRRVAIGLAVHIRAVLSVVRAINSDVGNHLVVLEQHTAALDVDAFLKHQVCHRNLLLRSADDGAAGDDDPLRSSLGGRRRRRGQRTTKANNSAVAVIDHVHVLHPA